MNDFSYEIRFAVLESAGYYSPDDLYAEWHYVSNAFSRSEVRDPSFARQPDLKPGDTNDDGFVDGRDVVRLMKWLAGDDVCINLSNADTTLDEVVDEHDLLRMISLMGGMVVLDGF